MPITQSDIGVFRNKLRTLEREIAKLMKAETSCCGITLPQCHILIEIEQKQENQQRDAPEEPDIDGDEAPEQRVSVDLPHGEGRTESEPKPHRPHHHDQGHDRSLEEVRKGVNNGDQTFRHPVLWPKKCVE